MAGEMESVKKGFDLPSGKQISVFLLIVVLAGAVYFVATSWTVNDTSSGPTTKQIDNFVARETASWTGEETDEKFSSGEMPEMLKISGFNDLYIGITMGGAQGYDIELNIINTGEKAIMLDSITVITNVEFTNNPGKFEEYEVNILPEGGSSFKGYSRMKITKNIKESDLFGTFIESFYVAEVKIK
ncbi:hypothetical protein GQ568_01490 [Patescibacteria group bacterium]|nr:hypothetical protein [Patescibacteria group bacterium]